MLNVTVKGLSRLQKNLKAESKRQNKALETAVKVEGFRLMRTLKKQIRSGNPGGSQFDPLSMIRRKMKRSKKPLNTMTKAVRYNVTSTPFQMAIGWTGPRVSKRWKALAEMHQEGFTVPVTDKLRKKFIRVGKTLTKRSKFRKYFFLRKGTKTLSVPKREIMEPFWESEKNKAWRNVRRNFKAKMRGERI